METDEILEHLHAGGKAVLTQPTGSPFVYRVIEGGLSGRQHQVRAHQFLRAISKQSIMEHPASSGGHRIYISKL